MIEIKNLNKSFNNQKVLKNVNIKFEKGTIFGLIGINGAGKSTLLRLMMDIYKPDSGQILIDDMSIQDNHEIKKSIFYLSDSPPFNMQMTFRDLADLYKVFYPFDEEKFKSILNLFSLDEHINLSQISKGMKRQGYIALAFASQATYLLLDEVFDGLDPVARLKFKKLMIESDYKDKIIIITSHSLRELEDICDAFGMIEDGHFKRYGDLDFELSKLKKYQIILKNSHQIQFTANHPSIVHYHQEGRILTLFIESNQDISEYINSESYHVVDQLPISFEEYFMINHQEGSK